MSWQEINDTRLAHSRPSGECQLKRVCTRALAGARHFASRALEDALGRAYFCLSQCTSLSRSHRSVVPSFNTFRKKHLGGEHGYEAQGQS
jgi:hypothetical protein